MDFLHAIKTFLIGTNLIAQIENHDFHALYLNPWFYIPVGAFILYKCGRKAFKAPIVLGVFLGLGWFVDTPYCQDLVVNGEIQLEKVLPVVGVLFISLIVALYALIRVE